MRDLINPEPLDAHALAGLMTKYPPLALSDFRQPIRGVYATLRAWVRVWRFRHSARFRHDFLAREANR